MSSSIIKRSIGIILAVTIVGAIALRYFHPAPAALSSTQVTINTTNQPTLGKASAPVHVIVFEDLKCGNCMRFSTKIFPKLKHAFIDTGKVKFTLINLAFIPGSMPAANAARCLYVQNKNFFFPYIENVYQHQPPENQDWATIPKLITFTQPIPGVDKNALADCIYESAYTPFIENNLKIAEKALKGVVETPAIFVNGHQLMTIAWPALESAINAAH